MSAPPAVEGMLLHSILHRAEGDFENARAWLGDVGDACLGWVPKHRGKEGKRLDGEVWRGCGLEEAGEGKEGSLLKYVYASSGDGEEEARRLVDDVEAFRKNKGGEEEQARIEERTRRELERVLEWCVKKFGDGAWVDASSAWVKPGEEVKKIGNDMVSGDKGWRKF
jgi:hypothetical protein